MTQAFPVFSTDDQNNPYREYRIRTSLQVDAGSVAMPLAYQAAAPGVTLPTSRILQTAQPFSVVYVQWFGIRIDARPQPPLIGSIGTFVLAAAGAEIDNVGLGSDMREIITASGWMSLYTTSRPENLVLPSLLAPWDGRYGNGIVNYSHSYTPTDLGFGGLLPGVAAAQPYNKLINNPPAQSSTASFLL